MVKIVIENLKYRYPETTNLALDNISLTILPGELLGIVGRIGAGKSTLCQAIVGLVPNFYKGAYGGRVLVDDLEVKKAGVHEVCKKVGLVFQNPFNQITGSKLTVYEEIAFGLENMGIPKGEMIVRIEEAMDILDIGWLKNRSPFELSGGQMQRMAIASIIAMKPEIIILDEPTSQLDPEGSEEVFSAVQKLSKKGITIIMVEHKIEKLATYSDRVVLMNEGKVIAVDTPQRLFSREDISTYGVEPPMYTKIFKGLGIKYPKTSLYPVTLEEAKELLTPVEERGGSLHGDA